MNKRNLLIQYLIALITALFLFPASTYCSNYYVKGKIAVTFKSDVEEEKAIDFIKRLNLKIIRKGGFDLPSLEFNVESNIDSFINEVKKEPIVGSATKGEELKTQGRVGMVVKVKFKTGTEFEQVEEIGLKYRKRKEVIAWRYHSVKRPFIVVGVPVGKEEEWIEIFKKPELKDVVLNANLIGLDL